MNIEEKIKQIILYKQNKINLLDLHPEVEFIISSSEIQFKNCQCSFNFLYDQNLNETYYDVVKIKIDENLKNIQEVKKLFTNEKIKKIRLDGNKKLTIEFLELFLSQLDKKELQKIEYIEEPTNDLYQSQSVLQKYNLYLAIDESLNQIKNFNEFEIYILKPSLIGLSKTKELIETLSKLNKKTIISSGYENSQGMNALIHLADLSNQLQKNNEFHGLDTFKYFDSKIFKFKRENNKLFL